MPPFFWAGLRRSAPRRPVTLIVPFAPSIAGPKGMDPAIGQKIHDAFKMAYDDPRAPEIYDKFEFSQRYMNSADYTVLARKLTADEKAMLEKVGLAWKE